MSYLILTSENFSSQIQLTCLHKPQNRALWPFAHFHQNALVDAPRVQLLRNILEEAFILCLCQNFGLIQLVNNVIGQPAISSLIQKTLALKLLHASRNIT